MSSLSGGMEVVAFTSCHSGFMSGLPNKSIMTTDIQTNIVSHPLQGIWGVSYKEAKFIAKPWRQCQHAANWQTNASIPILLPSFSCTQTGNTHPPPFGALYPWLVTDKGVCVCVCYLD